MVAELRLRGGEAHSDRRDEEITGHHSRDEGPLDEVQPELECIFVPVCTLGLVLLHVQLKVPEFLGRARRPKPCQQIRQLAWRV